MNARQRQRRPVGHKPMARLLTRVKIPPAHVGAQDEPHGVCVIVQVTHRRLNAQLLTREIAVAPVDQPHAHSGMMCGTGKRRRIYTRS